MGDYQPADSEGASGGGKSDKREDDVQTVQSTATVQSEDEGYDTLMPVVSNTHSADFAFYISVWEVNQISRTIACLNWAEK